LLPQHLEIKKNINTLLARKKKKIKPPKTAIVLIQNRASCTPSGPPHSIGNTSLRVHVSGQNSSSFESHTKQFIGFETKTTKKILKSL
jgi:hypothetical protein